MLKVMIVEDEKPILELIEMLINKNQQLSIIGSFVNPIEALKEFPLLKPDVVFLDIEMPKMTGLQLAEKMLEINENIQIVFLTAYRQYALDAFKVHAVDYIMKPIRPNSIDRITDRLMKIHELLSFKTELKETHFVSLKCLGTFEVRNNDNKTLVKWPTKKTEELFSYLLMHHDQIVTKWKLIDLFWAELEESRAIQNLYNTIYRIKKVVKENNLLIQIEKTTEGYSLKKDQSIIFDVEVLRKYIQQHLKVTKRNVDESEGVFSLYKGTLFGSKDCLWGLNYRVEMTEHYTKLARNLVLYYLENNQTDQAVIKLNQYLSIYPLNEEMNLLLLKLYSTYYAETNHLNDHYQHFKKLLNDELGIQPPLEAQKMIRGIV
ncbi:response regulator [Chengkuizengella axinellae]|uniref:Response regulator n=1 Tax=Chengkuizengella axinellae TaxID=3064388 RepID=A0ABT9J1D6_9BACL|nr:response regulator [Chengkuizengella sp. 2205SS18-9]MDP5275293.1 response regulator [Chengkuizengella sp. 2205SS18-9]